MHPVETRETALGLLITQRSQVRILPPLPPQMPPGTCPGGHFNVDCDQICDHGSDGVRAARPVRSTIGLPYLVNNSNWLVTAARSPPRTSLGGRVEQSAHGLLVDD